MKPLRQVRGQVARTQSVPAPVGGLNAVDSIAEMPPNDAVVLDNWFPKPSYIELRQGYTNWATGFPGWVESLMGYSNVSGEKLFAASGTKFYDATSQGAIGAAVVTGLTNARWEHTNLATAAGQYLYAMNGVDKPQLFDGTNWTAIDGGSTPAITGVTTTTLRNPVVWKNRLWMVETATLHAWYLPVQSVGGAASKWDLGTIFKLGGELRVILTASIATASDFDDYIAFLTTEGEIAIYAGTDPATAGLFVLQGVYRIGKPVGRRCFFKNGADSLIICSDGLVSLSALVRQGRGKKAETVSYKIQNLINTDVQAFNGNFGWQGVVHALGNKIIVNVPEVQNTLAHQYVQNTVSGSWCRFTGWNAACFEVLGDKLYFGANTIVALADTGQSDNGSIITGSCLPAFSYFKTDRQKLFTFVRPLFTSTGSVTPLMALNTDFNTSAPTGLVPFGMTTYSVWDVSHWDVSPWGASLTVRKIWQTVGGIGFTASLYIKVASKADTIQLNAIDYLFQPGGVL